MDRTKLTPVKGISKEGIESLRSPAAGSLGSFLESPVTASPPKVRSARASSNVRPLTNGDETQIAEVQAFGEPAAHHQRQSDAWSQSAQCRKADRKVGRVGGPGGPSWRGPLSFNFPLNHLTDR